jgi:UDP-N-acetylmuramoyl-L-alanyl-D-glutamate--2,6-diaminopimelate ligase
VPFDRPREKIIKLGELVTGVEDAVITGRADVDIDQIEYDSRLAKDSSLFVAVKGFRMDGYDFVEQARANGAVAVMGERESCPGIDNHVRVPNVRKALADVSAKFYGYPGMQIKACGVTGTNGKTTTCYLIKHILQARRKTTGLITSQTYDTGTHVFAAERTTPESLDLQRLLFLMKDNQCVNVVIEVSSHALMLHRVDNIDFRVAVYTNLTRDHLDFHQSMDEYFRAKAKLAGMLEGPLSYAVINLDVDEFRPLFGGLNCSNMSYSLGNPEADVHIGDYRFKADGTTFDLVTPVGTQTVSFKLPGRFNLQNAVAAAAGGLGSGADLDSVVAGLDAASPVPGRLEPLDFGQPFAIYVDYAHTPDAIARLCETAREFTKERLLLLFGCGGDRDRGKRPLMGKAATQNADFVVVTSDNPRSEDPLDIIEEVKSGLSDEQYEIQAERIRAIETILRKAKPGDTVLLAGKGAERFQEIKGEKHPFSDLAQAEMVLAQMGYEKSQTTEGI